jgi:GntR family transcriptional regulator
VEPSYIPRYHEIERTLQKRIEHLEPGDLLPSDTELCVEFDVSRMTARNAMQRLAQAGLVYRVPGRGTYVAQSPPHRQASSLLSFTREMERRKRRPTSQIIESGLRAPTDVERVAMRLGPGEPVFGLHRLRLADGRPIAVEAAVLRADCEPAVRSVDLEAESLHAALVASGLRLVRGRATVSAEPASEEDAELLEVEISSPLLIERRVIVDQRGRPVERTESRYAGERYALDVDFDVEDQPRSRGRGAATST